ncbi:uncharacterized protein LOC132617605 [Lycium barbarum]|uniref:uncharacterized protein LOC132617605 n=1 Tax=Lycium barbarum TaxID=112863 RepID=UPI00293E7E42|nr:uncharacterized protein LOC132617605 [Lycium barbarum]XP_060188629.1 uncharacterized protein LOC132617605 [Lycium barbarum]XP_060188630.1 uncharacterized protein LOC132617605 [Lycium barbarum]XP_060188631.1 uncharacterized protein LOC132617605 [Lycium barbarum]XP_060188632.1 uncharacterized protein LOC132617605 [Lycium barbarum]XP_060188633.1 uncharacterized protein LOC132617605 [Lycium barbarum]
MGSGEERPHWSIFDNVKTIPATPEALMAQINSAISKLEYAHAAVSCTPIPKNKNSSRSSNPAYDPQGADEAYRAGLAAMAAGKPEKAVDSLNVALSKCPPDKTSAVAKIQSLISVVSKPHKSSK